MNNEYSVPARYDHVVDLCKFVAIGAQEAGFDDDDIFRIELACDEACTNIIEHAYGGENQGKIHVVWRISDNAFVITINDNGQPFDTSDIPTPNIPSGPNRLDELRIGGLGLHFMRKLMDEIHFTSDTNGGNRLVMVKYLPRETSL